MANRRNSEVPEATRRELWRRSMGLCYRCEEELAVRAADPRPTATVAHIIALEDGGPRADPALPVQQRNALENLLLLCPGCHDVIDRDTENYSASVLHDLKEAHEGRIAAARTSAARGASNDEQRTSESAPRRFTDGTLRLSWVRDGSTELVLETDDFNVSLGRNANSRVHLPDSRDGRFHGHLSLVGTALIYQHLGRHPAYLSNATSQSRIAQGESCRVADKDRLQFASGTLLIESSLPDLYDPNARRTSTAAEEEFRNGQ